MLGREHVASGAVAGLAAGIALRLPPSSTALLAAFTAGFATFPDLDQCGSGPARSGG